MSVGCRAGKLKGNKKSYKRSVKKLDKICLVARMKLAFLSKRNAEMWLSG